MKAVKRTRRTRDPDETKDIKTLIAEVIPNWEWWIDTSRRSAAASAAGFHQRPSEPSRRATTAWPSPTARAPTGRSRNAPPSLPALPCADSADASPSSRASVRRLVRRRLIDEHDGDAVSDSITEPAVFAEQPRLFRAILQVALALGANEDGEKLFR